MFFMAGPRVLIAFAVLLATHAVHAQAPAGKDPRLPEKPNRPRTDRFGDPLPEGALFRTSTVRARHDVSGSLRFSGDGRLLAAFGGDKTVRLWEASTGKLRRVFSGHQRQIADLVFSADGRLLVSGDEGGSIHLWDATSGALKFVMTGHRGSIHSLVLTPDNRLLASCDGYEIRLWDTSTGKQLRVLARAGDIFWSVDISPDGKTLVAGLHEHPLAFWDLSTGAELHQFEKTDTERQNPVFLPDGKRLLTTGAGEGAVIWEVATGKKLASLKAWGPIALTRDGKILASGPRGFWPPDAPIFLWDLASLKEIRRLRGHQDGVFSLAFSPDGSMLASLGGDQTLRRWDPQTGRELDAVVGHANAITALAFSPDGILLASGSADRTVRLWDSETGREVCRLEARQEVVQGLAFLPGGDTLLSQNEFVPPTKGDGMTEDQALIRVRLWDVRKAKERRHIDIPKAFIHTMAFSPRTEVLAMGGFKSIRFLDLHTGKMSQPIAEPPIRTMCMAFSPDGRHLAVTSDESGIRETTGLNLWEVSTGRNLWSTGRTFEMFRGIAFSPDGKTLATGGNSVHLWDANSGKETGRLEGGRGCVAFSHNGKILATGGPDNSVMLWDLPTRSQRRRFTGHVPSSTRLGRMSVEPGVSCLAFSPNDRLLATGGDDTLVIVYDVMNSR